MAKAKEVELTAEASQLIYQWSQIDAQLEKVKAEEFALRQSVVMKAGFDPSKLEGSQTISIGNGWKLKVQKTQNYTLTNDEHQTEKLLAQIATGVPEKQNGRPDIAVGLVRWEPKMSTKTYKDELLPLVDELGISALLAAALTVKPGAPQLELIPPPAPKEEIQIEKAGTQ